MSRVNILGYRRNAAATLGRDLVLTVDRRALVDVLEEALPANARTRVWREKRDARVVTQNLAKSSAQPGDYALLTCAHCQLPEDLSLAPFSVRHEGALILWRVSPPGAGLYFEGEHWLDLRFHKPQYKSVVARILGHSPSGA
jgi:hypothetical protein